MPHLSKHLQQVVARFSLWQVTLAFASGILMALATAPLNWFPLAWVALAPLWVLVAQPVRESGGRRSAAIVAAFAWGLGYHGLALSWISGLHPLTWMGIPWLVSVAIVFFCWVFITLWGVARVVAWAWLVRKFWGVAPTSVRISNPYLRVLLGTAIWCGLEWLWIQGPLDWTALSYTQSPGNLWILHLGRLSGPAMVTAAIVAVNGLLAEAWMQWSPRQGRKSSLPPVSKFCTYPFLLVSTGVLLVGLHGTGLWLYSQPLTQPPEMELKIGIVQGNVPTRIKLFSEGLRLAETGYTEGYRTLVDQGVDAVLTPEGALPLLWDRQTRDRSPFQQAVVERGVPAWLGTFTLQPEGIARSLVTIGESGEVLSRYDKIKLVPLGEYLPFANILGGVVRLLTTIDENGVPGRMDQIFKTPFGQAIASICYDSAFPEVFRAQAAAGGQFILTASNLDPYSEVLMAQHQAHDLMRAIETDRWAARATNTGYSSIIDPHGAILWQSQPQTYQVYAGKIFRRQSQTPYVRWGDWLTPLLLVVAAVVWGSQITRQHQGNDSWVNGREE